MSDINKKILPVQDELENILNTTTHPIIEGQFLYAYDKKLSFFDRGGRRLLKITTNSSELPLTQEKFLETDFNKLRGSLNVFKTENGLSMYYTDASGETFEITQGSGSSVALNHNGMLGRDEDDAHPISAITGLEEALDEKVDIVDGILINPSIGEGNETWTITDEDTTDPGNLIFKKDSNYMTIKSDGVYFNNIKLGSGAITSVGLALPTEFTVSNSPVINSGTLTGVWKSQTAKTFFAAPNSAPGTPSFRTIVPSDIPALNYITKTASRTPDYIPTWGNADGGSLGSGYSVETTLTGGSGAIPRADAVKTYVDGILAANDAMVFKGTIGSGGTYEITAFNDLTTYNAGWTYKVITAGQIKGKVAEIGDLVMATVDRTGTSAVYSD